MANKRRDKEIIKIMLEENEICTLNLLNFTHINSNKKIPLSDVLILLDNCNQYNDEINNKKSKHYKSNNDLRRDSLMQMSFRWLISNKYNEYYMIDTKLPLSVECFINNKTNMDTEIDDLLCERIKQQADEYNKTYPEIIEIIKNQFYEK